MDDCPEVSAAFKVRDRPLPASNWPVFKWVKLRVEQDFSRHQLTELDGNRLIRVHTDCIRFGTMLEDCHEVFAAFRFGVVLSRLRIGQFPSGSNSGFWDC
jgi:hypothetical protein